MSASLKNLSLSLLVICLLGCSSNPGGKTDLAQENENIFFKDTPFAESVNRAISKIAGEHFPRENVTVSPLNGGMTLTQIFLLTINDKKYILRILSPRNDMASKINEIRAHTYAAQIGLAPPLTYVDEKLQFMIMPYIEGHNLSLKDLDNPKVLKKIGGSLAKLHRYKGEFNQNKPQIYRTQRHLLRAQEEKVALPSAYQGIYEKYHKEGLELNKNPKSLVLCHGDLNPTNIIVSKDGNIYFIDWTSATLDNRYTDLGYFSLVNGLNDNQSRVFLNAYFGQDLTDKQWSMFKNSQRRTSFLTATVWFHFSESNQDKRTPPKKRIKKLDMLLKDPQLKTGLEYAKSHEVVSPRSESKEAIRLYALGFLKTYMEWKQ